MLDFPPWKIVFILGVCLLGLLAAFPNFLSEEGAAELPGFLPNKQINLGLDLQGGSHMLLGAETDAVIEERIADLESQIRATLRDKSIVASLTSVDRTIRVRLRDTERADEAEDAIEDLAEPLSQTSPLGGPAGRNIQVDQADSGVIEVTLTDAAISERINSAIQQSLEVVRRRVDALGTREPNIQRQGADRILVQVPGLQDSQQLRDMLSQTAKLTFHMVNPGADPNRPPPGYMTMPSRDGAPLVIERRAPLSGENLADAGVGFDEYNRPVVTFRFDSRGGARFAELTRQNVGQQFAIVLDGEIISAPRINEPIPGGTGQISGNFTVETANDLAILLNAGAFAVPLTILEERTVGPDLGQDSVDAGKMAAIIGLVGVLAFILLTYGRFGIAANTALAMNILLILGGLSAIGATLTLPGIAGIVLTIGMAVDANVLIFERIREEAAAGRQPLRAVEAGYEQAMSTILDANITTFIAAFLLFQFGTGPVRGFAVTLGVGILTSLFTAIMVTRLLLVVWLRRRRPQSLPI